MPKIIFATDNKKEFIELILKIKDNYSCDLSIVQSGKEILERLIKEEVDILIIDLEMNNTNGIQICSEIRSVTNSCQPFIIIISEKTEDYTQALVFDSGADDFLLKPLKAPLLAARIKAMMKRKTKQCIKLPSTKKEISMDYERRLLLVDTKEIELPKKEFNLLFLFYSNPEKMFTRTEIAKSVWGDASVGGSKRKSIDIHLSKIRNKIGTNYIRTVSGIGYIFSL